MHFLKQCNRLASRVVVSLNTDEFIESYKGKPPILTYEERKESIKLSNLVFDIIPNTGGADSKPAILSVKPDIICIGDDWAKKDYYKQMSFTQEWLDEQNILLCYIPYHKGISTTEIKRRLNG